MNADERRSRRLLVTLGMLVVAASAQPLKDAPVKPIESLWLTSVQPFRGGSERDRVLARALKKWRQAKVFDAVMLLDLPPTFADEKEFNVQANALIINRFCLLSSPQFLDREPWSEFYRTLPKVTH